MWWRGLRWEVCLAAFVPGSLLNLDIVFFLCVLICVLNDTPYDGTIHITASPVRDRLYGVITAADAQRRLQALIGEVLYGRM